MKGRTEGDELSNLKFKSGGLHRTWIMKFNRGVETILNLNYFYRLSI